MEATVMYILSKVINAIYCHIFIFDNIDIKHIDNIQKPCIMIFITLDCHQQIEHWLRRFYTLPIICDNVIVDTYARGIRWQNVKTNAVCI